MQPRSLFLVSIALVSGFVSCKKDESLMRGSIRMTIASNASIRILPSGSSPCSFTMSIMRPDTLLAEKGLTLCGQIQLYKVVCNDNLDNSIQNPCLGKDSCCQQMQRIRCQINPDTCKAQWDSVEMGLYYAVVEGCDEAASFQEYYVGDQQIDAQMPGRASVIRITKENPVQNLSFTLRPPSMQRAQH